MSGMRDTRDERPTVSIYELGSALGTIAGMEYAETMTAPVEGAKYRIAGLFDAPDVDAIKNYLRDLDGSIESFRMDAQRNITREAFLQSLNEWLFRWKQFYGERQTTTQILLKGRDTTMTEAKEYGVKLEGWRKLYQQETGKTPEGQTPTTPKDVVSPLATSASTKILLVLAAAGVVGLLGYMTYRYVKKAKSDVDRAENLVRGYAEKAIMGGVGGGSGGLPHGQGHASLGE